VKKKVLLATLLVTAFILGSVTASASTNWIKKTIEIAIPKGWHYVIEDTNGKQTEITFKESEHPFNYNGRVYMPAAVLLEAVGFGIKYDAENETTIFYLPDYSKPDEQPKEVNSKPVSPKNEKGEWIYIEQPQYYYESLKKDELGITYPDLSYIPVEYANGKLPKPANQREWNPPNWIFNPDGYRYAGRTVLSLALSSNDVYWDFKDGEITAEEAIDKIESFKKEAKRWLWHLGYGEENLYEAYDLYLAAKDQFDLYIEAIKNPDDYQLSMKATQKTIEIDHYWLRLRWAVCSYIGYEEK
jgi:hypothetical protein